MTAEELLKSNERSALENTQYISSVSGKTSGKLKSKKKALSWSATGLIIAAVAVAAILFSSGNIIPAKIQERLIEETDIQYADMVASKMLAFQQALYQGDIPDDTAENLKVDGILVGYINEGEFVEDNKSGKSSVLNTGKEIISADDFITKVYEDVTIYNAINNATYGRAAGYYDEEAYKVFDEIGTTRNNYTSDTSIPEVMDRAMGEGSNVQINSVSLVEQTEKDPDTGEEVTTYRYEESGAAARSGSEAEKFVESVRTKITSSSADQSTLGSADSLKVADTISKEQRSSLFYLLFMENVSKMKAGDGNESQLNEAMNYLYLSSENEIVDTRTGEVIKVTGTALDSPSLYAVLAGSDNMNMEMVGNYSSDRILKTVENQIDANNKSGGIIVDTVASTDDKTKGSVGRFIDTSIAVGSEEILNKVTPTVNTSLVKNSYESIKGISAGEFLVEGAVNVGKRLAKASGATGADGAAAAAYEQLNSKILALEAESDRLNRSPFDITSRNTFLGSIIYKFAIAGSRFGGVFGKINTLSTATSQAILSLASTTYADGNVGYLSKLGDCETYAIIGMVGSAQCSEIAVFDTSTLDNPFGNPEFINFVEENTVLNNGVREIKDGSRLAEFIIYNDERKTPMGVTDGGILDSLSGESRSIPFVGSILSLVEMFIGANEDDVRMATGESFVNSSSNPDWQTYKYAQRYVSLARATAILRQYSDDSTAYSNIKFFEGDNNPVVAYRQHYYNTVAQK